MVRKRSNRHDRDIEPSDLGNLVAYRLRAVSIATRVTLLALVAMVGYLALGDHPSVRTVPYLLLVGIAAAAVAALSSLPWPTLLLHRRGLWVMYGWSALDVGLISGAVALSGFGHSEMWGLYALTTIFSASVYPRRGQVALLAFTGAAYAAVLLLDPGSLSVSALSFRLVGVSLVAVIGGFLAGEMAGQMSAHREAWEESEARARLLSTVAEAARSMSCVDAERVLAVVIESAATLGCQGAEICQFDPANGVWRVGQRAGHTAAYDLTQPIDTGVAGLVWEGGEMIVMDDYAAWSGGVPAVQSAGYRSVVAVPIRSGGELTGALVVGMLSQHDWAAHEIEGIQLLAAQAGAALDLARLFAERDEFQAQLSYQAFHDGLTGLPNRSLFLDRLEQARARARRSGTSVAVLFLDLDRFKTINDSLGHAAGDQLLVEVALRLSRAVGPYATLARYGGDEFTVVLQDVAEEAEVDLAAARLLVSLEAPFVLGGHDVFVTASVGIAVDRLNDAASAATPLGVTTGRLTEQQAARDLVRDADLAMYRAKGTGAGRSARFEPGMNDAAIRKLELELALRLAVERDQLVLAYQPVVDLDTEEIVSVEALVRWRHPTRGEISPVDFISLAEETGLIRSIGSWVLEQACSQTAAWLRSGLELGVAVNLSASQFDADLPALVGAVLERTGLPAAQLTLEITETVVMEAPDAVETMAQLHAMGVRIALDDFGQGYSSLGYLKRFPLDTVKIDKAFIDGIVDDPQDRAIVASVVAIGAELGFSVVAEGIERSDQLERVRAMGCHQGQGYLFARPLTARAVTALSQSGLAAA